VTLAKKAPEALPRRRFFDKETTTVKDDFENEKKSRYLTKTLTDDFERYVSTTFDTKTPFLKILFLFLEEIPFGVLKKGREKR